MSPLPEQRVDFDQTTSVGVGTVNGSGVSVKELAGGIHQSVFTLRDLRIALTDTGGANGAYGSQKLYDFPAGHIKILGAVSNLSSVARVGTNITATAAVKHALGTAAEAANDTLDSTSADILPSTSITLAAGEGSGGGVSTAEPLFDGTDTAKDLYLNVGIADAGIAGADSVDITGEITVTWVNLGDN